MVNKSSYVIAFFAMIFLAVSLASASSDLIFNQTSFGSSSYNVQQGSSVTFNVLISNENDTYPVTSINLNGASSTIADLGNNSNQTVSFKIDVASNENLGNKIYTINATGSLNGSQVNSNIITVTLNITQSDQNKIFSQICGTKYAPESISFGEVEDNEDGNEDEWDWMPTNKISITVNDIYNKVDDDEKFDVSLLFYQGITRISGSKIASDDDDLEIEDLKIDGEEEENADFDFIVSSDAKNGDYDMYVKVDGKYGCYVEKLNKQVSIDTEDGDYSIVSDVRGPTSSNCGENVDLAVTVSNIGDDDADKVKVILYNRDLGINMFKEIDNLDKGDEAVAYFSFVAPQNAVERSYRFNLYTEFDYDDDDEEYEEYSDDEYDYTYTLSLSGNCIDPTKPTLSAKLNSSAVVGEDLVVAVTFKNNGNVSTSAIIAPEDFESWAELLSEPETITVGRSESKTVYITFKPIKAGQQTFNINAIYNGKSVDQPVTVSIEANPSVISSLKEKFGVTGAYLVLGIAILVFLIILVLIVKFIFWLFRKH
jgi:hypothetical protein